MTTPGWYELERRGYVVEESHIASFRERIEMYRLLIDSAKPHCTRRQLWAIRRIAIVMFIKPWSTANYYVKRGVHDGA